MSIVVVGGGAIGLLVAGKLARSAQRVAMVARPGTVQAFQEHPLLINQGKIGLSIGAPPAATDPAALPAHYQQPDLAILCVKSYATQEALTTLAALQPAYILTLQNGIGNEEVLAHQFGADRMFAGAITSSVEVDKPWQIVVTKPGGIGLAPVGDTPGLRMWAAMLLNAGFKVRQYADYRALKWSKALLNMLGNATPAILDMSVEAVYADPRLIALERRACLEALLVMQRRGIRPVNLPSYPAKLLAAAMRWLPEPMLFPLLRRSLAGGRGGKLPSLHADLRRERTVSEGAYLYGAVAQAASESGMAAPVNATLWRVLHGIVAGSIAWDTFRQQPERLLEAVSQQAETMPPV